MLLEEEFDSVARFLTSLSALADMVGDEAIWFRGHSNKEFKLLPSLARLDGALERESILAKRFKQNAYSFRQQPPQDEWEWLFLMQHFGIPTRLLDWTESPLTALYFAVSDAETSHDEHDGAIWALLPAKYNYEIPRLRPVVPIDIPCFGVDSVLDDYGPEKMNMELMTSRFPAAAIAHRRNERIMAQLGVFTIMHRDMTPIEDLAAAHLAKLVIPSAAKPRLRKELSSLRVNRLMLFPELASVADVTKEILK